MELCVPKIVESIPGSDFLSIGYGTVLNGTSTAPTHRDCLTGALIEPETEAAFQGNYSA